LSLKKLETDLNWVERPEPDGLESADIHLFKNFKRAVDRAYPPNTASKKKKP
jgi:hypothetical protein